MTFKSFVIIGMLGFSACAPTHTQQVSNQLDSKIKIELRAWEYTQQKYDKTCPYGGGKDVPRAKAVENVACYEDIARSRVVPLALNPNAVNNLLLNYRENAIKYKKGEIDKDEAKLNGQRLWIQYTQTMDTQTARTLNMAAQQDAIVAQQRQEYFKNLSQSIQQAEQANQSTMQNTNCQVWNNQMNCTTW